MSSPLSLLSLLLLPALVSASPLLRRQNCTAQDSGYDIDAVISVAKQKASHSWEYGTTAEALLELYNPELSVFSKNPFPNGKLPVVDPSTVQSLVYAKQFINTTGDVFIDGDGAIGDPASLGPSALLLGVSSTNSTNPTNPSAQDYLTAASRQTQTILHAPRYPNGALSQRTAYAELWADFMYMAPPYLAYYAVHTGDEGLLREVVRQCGLYRAVLGTNGMGANGMGVNGTGVNGTGLWKHIVGPDNQDVGHWSTGNGWAAMGMARVLATVRGWERSKGWGEEVRMLEGWVGEILDGAKDSTRADGLLRNYVDDEGWFGETSGTALLTAATYRMAVLAPERFGAEYTDWAEENRRTLAGHVGDDGILAPAVNPLGWGDRSPFLSGSPEGQAFGAMVGAAWRDWKC